MKLIFFLFVVFIYFSKSEAKIDIFRYSVKNCLICDQYEDDWKYIKKHYKNTNNITFYDIDCNVDVLKCKQNNIDFIPTIKYNFLNEENVYHLDHNKVTLMSFIKSVDKSCTLKHLENCNEEFQKLVGEYNNLDEIENILQKQQKTLTEKYLLWNKDFAELGVLLQNFKSFKHDNAYDL